jgi:transcriptional repressor NrdR
MKCPYCQNEETRVMDKRDHDSVSRRRRECLKCGKRFTTYERIELDLWVSKKNDKREKFSREKLKKGVLKALEKRQFDKEEQESIIDKIESRIYTFAKDKDITSKKVGEIVMAELKKVDKIAYLRFVAVYREIDSIEEFEEELNKLGKKSGKKC